MPIPGHNISITPTIPHHPRFLNPPIHQPNIHGTIKTARRLRAFNHLFVVALIICLVKPTFGQWNEDGEYITTLGSNHPDCTFNPGAGGETFPGGSLPFALEAFFSDGCFDLPAGTRVIAGRSLRRFNPGENFFVANGGVAIWSGRRLFNGGWFEERRGVLKFITSDLSATLKPEAFGRIRFSGEAQVVISGQTTVTVPIEEEVLFDPSALQNLPFFDFRGTQPNVPDATSSGGSISDVRAVVVDTFNSIVSGSSDPELNRTDIFGSDVDEVDVGITVRFLPKDSVGSNVNQQGLAEQGGYIAFRWVQKVGLVDSWEVSEHELPGGAGQITGTYLWSPKGIADTPSKPIRNSEVIIPYVVDDGSNLAVSANNPQTNVSSFWFPQGDVQSDEFDYYYNNGWDGNSLQDFVNFPVQPAGMFSPGEKLSFTTTLVGVTGPSNNYEPLITVRWTSNVTAAPDTSDPIFDDVGEGAELIGLLSLPEIPVFHEYVDGNVTLIGVTKFVLGDVNLDEVVNLLDVAPFIELLSNSQFQDEADMNRDGAVNLLDVGPFIAVLSGN